MENQKSVVHWRRALQLVGVGLILTTVAGASRSGVRADPLVPSFPPGAVASFDADLDSPTPPAGKIQIKPQGAASNVAPWVLEPTIIRHVIRVARATDDVPDDGNIGLDGRKPPVPPHRPRPSSGAQELVFSLGFVVPQLPRGTYEARHGEQSLTLQILPELKARRATLCGPPGTEANVQVGIGPASIPGTDRAGPTPLHVPITLRSENRAVADLAPGQDAIVTTGGDGYATWRVQVHGGGRTEFTATAPGFEPAAIAVIGKVSLPLSDKELQPGDILLYHGIAPVVSPAIIQAEQKELGPDSIYSHAGLYVGKDSNGVPRVAEMLRTGYWITRLEISTAGSSIVDVFRWTGIDPARQEQIADIGKHLCGDPAASTRDDDPNDNSPKLVGGRYAYEQIGLLAEVATGANPLRVQLHAVAVDQSAGAKRAMICSELVAWAYHDAGLDLQVKPWPDLEKAGILTGGDRWRDYTTPNMLARSPSLRREFRLKGDR